MERAPLGPPPVELLTSGDAEGRQRRAAGALRSAGLGAGDRVVFCLPSSAALLCTVLGAARIGVLPVLLNATLTQSERAPLVEDVAPALVVDDQRALEAMGDGGPVDLAPFPLARPMHYTSGTTGRPKGVAAGLWDDAMASQVFDDEADLWEIGPEDLHLVCSPMYHSVSIRFAGATLLRGGSCVVLGRFDAATALQVLRAERPTTTFMVPSHLQRLLTLPELDGSEKWDSLRLLAHAGEPCPHTLKRSVMARCRPGAVWEFYGSTEGQFTACSPDEWLERPGTVGRARPGRQLEIDPGDLGEQAANPGVDVLQVDAHPGDAHPRDGQPGDAHSRDGRLSRCHGIGAEGAGTIWCHAPPFARFEYWRDPRSTAAAWREDAFTVRDVGWLDGDGYLYLSGRRQDLIISGGVNVYPAEIEAVLSEVPGVHEVAVFGVPDVRWGQRVCAAVVADRQADVDDLRALAALRLAPYKRPKQYQRVDDLPHTATGKLRRGAVARLLGLTS